MNFEELKESVIEWAEDKGILSVENSKTQMLKVVEEIGELSSALLKNNKEETIDSIGDVFVTLIILSEQIGLDPTECLESAYNVIKDRKGKTVNGTFIKSN